MDAGIEANALLGPRMTGDGAMGGINQCMTRGNRQVVAGCRHNQRLSRPMKKIKLITFTEAKRESRKPGICSVCGKDLKCMVPADATEVKCSECMDPPATPGSTK